MSELSSFNRLVNLQVPKKNRNNLCEFLGVEFVGSALNQSGKRKYFTVKKFPDNPLYNLITATAYSTPTKMLTGERGQPRVFSWIEFHRKFIWYRNLGMIDPLSMICSEILLDM